MEPDNLKFGGGLAHTVLNPAVAIVVIIAGLWLCFGPRNRAIVGFLVTSFLIPLDQVLVVGPFHFPVIRILLLFGFIRIVWTKASSRSEVFSGGMNVIDKAMILLGLITAVNGLLLWRELAQVNYQLGILYSTLGIYFVARLLIREEEDILRVIRVFACIMVVIAIFMTYERLTGTNLIYSLLGGARATRNGTAQARGDEFRAMGPFSQPILAGTFGSVMLPLFVALWLKHRKSRMIALLGMIASMVVAVTANSSTALGGLAAGLCALCLWPLRKLTRVFRWGIVMTLVALQMVMKAPVWNLLARIDLSGGSDSYHRFLLVDQCIRHFWDWWLVGTRSNGNWGWDMWDIANQYVGYAETSGLIPLLIFVAILVWGFKFLGKARKAAEAEQDRPHALFLWAIGSALFANVIAFIGISYWDQSQVSWYALLAMISAATVAARAARPVPEAEVEMARPGLALRPHLVPGSARSRLPNLRGPSSTIG